MAMAELFIQPDYPVPEHGKVWFAQSEDGARLRFASWRPAGQPARGTVVIMQGRAEFIERYAETIAELLQRGFHVLTFDWRGQGGSQRLLPNPHKGHIDRPAQYEADLALAMHEMQAGMPGPYFVLAHSMGAALCLDAARRDLLPVSRLLALAPMLGLSVISFPTAANYFARSLCHLGFSRAFVPGGSATPISTKPFPGNRLTSDPSRYARNSALAKAAPHLTIGDPTCGWVRAAFQLMGRLEAPFAPFEVTVPTLILTAARDPVVSSPAIERFARGLSTGPALVLPGARHELLMETDAIRSRLWAAFDAFIPGEATPLLSTGEQGESGLVQGLVASGDDSPAAGGTAAVP